MTRKIALVGALALAMSLTASLGLARNASGDKSTGGIAFVNANQNVVEVSFNAHETPDPNADAPAKGRVDVRDHEFGGTFVDFRGDVDCYNNTGDDSATFTGQITEFDGPIADPNRMFFRVSVEDNGTPGWRGPDRITVNRSAAPFNCMDDHDAVRDVVRGNLVVHH